MKVNQISHTTKIGQHQPSGHMLDTQGEPRARDAEEHIAADSGTRAEHLPNLLGSIQNLALDREEYHSL